MKSILAIFLTATAVSAVPLREKREIRYHPMFNPDLFQGDIIVNDPTDRNVNPDLKTRWPKAEVPYVIDPSLWNIKPIISAAMEQYHKNTCVRFVEKQDHHVNYIRMHYGDGCKSHLGMKGGEQELSLGGGCDGVDVALHELGHALGFHHEHIRSDRDDYIEIFWDNLAEDPGPYHKNLPEQDILYTPFDIDSVMTYGKYLGSKDYGNLKVMESKKGFPPMRPEAGPLQLSKFDIYKVNKIYNCDNINKND